jgi:hypothetical protein
MARIRTIKPEFFTSSDIVALSPLARLLFIGLWQVADREGRMKWRPADFKLQILPGDQCDIDALCGEIVERGLVVLYGDELAYIPTFLEHQSINPREHPSKLTPPDACPTRAHASNPDLHAQRGKEGKGKEGNALARAPRLSHELPEDWKPSDEDRSWAVQARPDLTPAQLETETERFRNHAKANNRTAFAWGPNWRNWVSKAQPPPAPKPQPGQTPITAPEPWEQRMAAWRSKKFWMPMWGPKPGEPGCAAPKNLMGQA